MHKICLYASSFKNYKYRLNNKGLFQIRISVPWETPAFQKVILDQMLLQQSPDPRKEHGVWWELKSSWGMQTPGQTRDAKIDEQPFPDPHTKFILMLCP